MTENRNTTFPLPIHKIFRYKKFSKTQKGSLTKLLATVRQQIFDQRSWYSTLRQKVFFDTRKFLKDRRVPLRSFPTMTEKKFDKKTSYAPQSPTLVIQKILRQQKSIQTQKCSPTKFFGTVRQQIFEWRSWYSPLRHKNFRYQKFYTTQKISFTKFFGIVRQQFVQWRSWYSPLTHEFFRYQNSSKTQKVSFRKFFGTVRQQILQWSSWYSPPRHKIFWFRSISKTRKAFSLELFGTVRKHIFDKRSQYSLPPSYP